MEIIYGEASNIYLTSQMRLLRVVEGQTQITPYAGYLDPSLREENGEIRIPKSTDTEPLARTAECFTYYGSIVPGTVMVKTTGENFCVANGADEAVQPFGLLAQWVGGSFSNVRGINEIAVWRGPDAVVDILSPGFNDEEVAEKVSAAKAGEKVLVYAGTNGLLTVKSPGSDAISVGWIVSRESPSVLRINLTI